MLSELPESIHCFHMNKIHLLVALNWSLNDSNQAYETSAASTRSPWSIALTSLKDPMNVLLAVTAIVGIVVGQPDSAVILAILVALNVILGTRQELAAHASAQALDTQQVPVARVRRSGAVEELEATALVPGDLLLIEAGDIVPADCRITEAAALEVTESEQNSFLTYGRSR